MIVYRVTWRVRYVGHTESRGIEFDDWQLAVAFSMFIPVHQRPRIEEAIT